jgi:hypothetical protein
MDGGLRPTIVALQAAECSMQKNVLPPDLKAPVSRNVAEWIAERYCSDLQDLHWSGKQC